MNEPVAVDPDRCPRCAGRFTCGAAGPAPCDCFTLTLDPGLLAELRERYVGCLCLACLREITNARTDARTDVPTAGPA
ncbi:cysteine-rich CWC family protein [Methyloversatilis sp. XJ19-13]|uniref:cysteine-rich CWC family protein n=1 Tax=Methyloversatilis sp. XJ19-13 TaxID=2963430 RepID=UPI00211C3649|nr:cysteine-rich CWC family protein [Methyloversatilis sp. XJ19-13]MCQ9372996.1 cysteine-rich CWC family protein [Methyloversatilis sp. XJ19-13]